MKKTITILFVISLFISCEKEKIDTNRFLKIFETSDNEGFEAIRINDNQLFLLTSHLKSGEVNLDYSGTDWNMELQRYDDKGNLLNAKIFEKPYSMDVARDMCFTKGNDLIITGNIQDAPEFYSEQIWVIKTTKQFETLETL